MALAKTRGPLWAELSKVADRLVEHAQNEEMVDTGYTEAGHLMLEAAKYLRVGAARGYELQESMRRASKED